MEHFRYLINLSILGGRVLEPLTMEIAKSIDSLTFLDRIDVAWPRRVLAISVVHDEVSIFDANGNDVDIKNVIVSTAKVAEMVGKMNDGITVIGYERLGEFVLADAYQEEQIFSRKGSGWLSPTFGPAYFKWVLQGEPLFRYCVLKNGFVGMSKADIKRHTGGGYCVVRTHSDGIFQSDERTIYYIDGGFDD